MEDFISRGEYLCHKIIDKLNLDLNGLNILTEAASGYYSWNPILAAMAGAAKVVCLGRDSDFGRYEENKSKINEISKILNLDNKISIFNRDKKNINLKNINIVTNSGLLRPIDKTIIPELNNKAVIPLMWETWEFRNTDIDILLAKSNQIPVIGTNEDFRELKMHQYNGYYMLKLLFDMKIEVYHNHIAIFGHRPASHCVELFKRMNVNYTWFSPNVENDRNSFTYSELNEILKFKKLDAIIFADHETKNQIIGKDSLISFQQLFRSFPHLRIGHVCGTIDIDELKKTSLYYFPKKLKGAGFMSYQPDEIGAQPVLELYAAGLKVGEIASKARLKGFSVEETIKATVDYGIGQDFKGGFMNYDPNMQI